MFAFWIAVAIVIICLGVFIVLLGGGMPDARAMLLVGMIVAGIGLVLWLIVLTAHGAMARDFGQWETTDLKVRQWYQSLMQPDNPAVSCCGEADAYWADSFEVDGDKYVAIVTDPRPDEPLRRKHVDIGTRIVVPNHKLKYDQSNPTGHGIIFLSRGDYVYCYVAPGGV